MSEPTYRVEVIYGTVESQTRDVLRNGWMHCQSRRIDRNMDGRTVAVSEWKDTGVRWRFGGNK